MHVKILVDSSMDRSARRTATPAAPTSPCSYRRSSSSTTTSLLSSPPSGCTTASPYLLDRWKSCCLALLVLLPPERFSSVLVPVEQIRQDPARDVNPQTQCPKIASSNPQFCTSPGRRRDSVLAEQDAVRWRSRICSSFSSV